MTNQFAQEIMEQPEALCRAVEGYPAQDALLMSLSSRISSGELSHIILTGMGASLFACYPLWLTLARHGIPATIWDTSELINYGINILSPRSLVLVVSQSGESAEIRRLVEFEKPLGLMIGVTNQVDSSLGKRADVTLELHAGEEATVSTKTYTTSLAVLRLLGEQIISGNLSAERQNLIAISNSMNGFLKDLPSVAEEIAAFLGYPDQLAILGRGFSMASVETSSLILKEASKIFTFGMSSAQFRHGPRELMQPGFRSLIFAGSAHTYHLNEQQAVELSSHTGQVVFITSRSTNPKRSGIMNVEIPAVSDPYLPIVEILPIQLLTIPLAKARGYEAGVFSHGEKITLTE